MPSGRNPACKRIWNSGSSCYVPFPPPEAGLLILCRQHRNLVRNFRVQSGVEPVMLTALLADILTEAGVIKNEPFLSAFWVCSTALVLFSPRAVCAARIPRAQRWQMEGALGRSLMWPLASPISLYAKHEVPQSPLPNGPCHSSPETTPCPQRQKPSRTRKPLR